MAKVYAQVDPWFIQHGYNKHTGVRDCRYAIKQNDLLFELHISATPCRMMRNPTTWMDLLGLHPKRRLPDKRPIQPDADRPLRAGKYKDLGTVEHNSTPDSIVPLERHHIVSQDTLKKQGKTLMMLLLSR